MKSNIKYIIIFFLIFSFYAFAEIYTVKSGDSLEKIAKKYGVTVRDIIKENSLKKPYIIYPGQKLKIPEKKGFIIHKVKNGENLSLIAQKYKVSVRDIIRANNLKKPYIIRIGQRLKIPIKKGSVKKDIETYCALKHKVRPGDTLITIAKKYRVWVKDIRKLNNLQNDVLRVGQVLCIKRGTKKKETKKTKSGVIVKQKKIVKKKIITYKVRSGDSLARIAKKYGTTVKEIVRLNNLKKPYIIYPGQRLKVPKKVVYIEEEIVKRKSIPFGFIWPVDGKVIQNFVNNSQMRHLGIDIESECDAPVRAAEDGKVIFAGDSIKAYGNLIVIKHPNKFNTVYGHIGDIHAKEGMIVKKGEIIGKAGMLKNSEKCGIYFEIRKNTVPVDPLVFLNKKTNLDKKKN
ncbi:LysM peptidoglycan-binding domain-containing protein [Persephonella sp.]